MTHAELVELIRLVAAGRRDAADSLADLLHPLLAKPEPKPATIRKKVPE